MQRTQLLLEDWQYERLKARAEREGRSLSNLVRSIVAAHLEPPPPGRRSGLRSIEGLAEDSDAAGRDHDRLLYDPRR